MKKGNQKEERQLDSGYWRGSSYDVSRDIACSDDDKDKKEKHRESEGN